MKNCKFVFIAGIVVLGLLTGCSTTKVKRVDVAKVVDLSGRWNDTDSRLIAKEMIEDCLNRRPWVDIFLGEYNRKPVVIVGAIVNRSHEHVSAEVFVKELEKNLINSGEVIFVASADERGAIRNERTAQNTEGHTAPETVKEMGQETGADFMLIGSINSVKDELRHRYVILYQTNLELIDLKTNEKVWLGQKHIKKTVERSKFSL